MYPGPKLFRALYQHLELSLETNWPPAKFIQKWCNMMAGSHHILHELQLLGQPKGQLHVECTAAIQTGFSNTWMSDYPILEMVVNVLPAESSKRHQGHPGL